MILFNKIMTEHQETAIISRRIRLLGCPMDTLTINATVGIIAERIRQRKFTQHSVINVAKLVALRKDKILYASVAESDLINIDGMGVVIGGRLLGYDIPERVTGIDLFHQLLQLSADEKFSVFLLGAQESIVQETRNRIEQQYPGIIIVGHHHGYFTIAEEKIIVRRIRNSGARILFVAFSSPKKEIFINTWKEQLGADFVMGVGGTFDVVAGKVKRAPQWMQKLGAEWLYRFIQEPRRMWKRYLVTNCIYLYILLAEKFAAFFDPTPRGGVSDPELRNKKTPF